MSVPANGNLAGYVDSVLGTWGFSYGTLNRLAQAVEGQAPTPFSGFQDLTQGMFKNYCWSYDAWGNRTDEEGSTSAYPSNAGGASACSSQPQTEYNANNQIVGSGAPSYDAAGDVTSDPSGVAGIPGKQPTDLRYLYDAEGRICAVGAEGGSVMTGYVYDADGNRVAKGPITSWSCDPTTNGFESSGNETNYVLNQSGQIVTETTLDGSGNAQWVYTNVYANGSLFATYNAQGLHFLLNDWLGTRRASVNASGAVESFCVSLPYGDDLICSGALDTPNEQHFTGKTHDQESGNDYFGARYYSENMGRFLSPDWNKNPQGVPYADFTNPQTLNLYQYMRNNPLGGVDPDGHDPTILDKEFAAQAAAAGIQVPLLQAQQQSPATLTDKNGNTVQGANGKPALIPAGFDVNGVLQAGKNDKDMRGWAPMVGSADTSADLAKFRRGGPWDLQRLSGNFDPRFIDSATILIGMYAAAADITRNQILDIENAVAATSSYPKDTKLDQTYTHLPVRNVTNTDTGMRLVQSGAYVP